MVTGDRIKFLGNPWINGHRIQEFFWSARLESSGIWFDLHLETVRYNAEDANIETQDTRRERVNESQSDWQSKIVWNNYHQCTLSSTNWDGTGFRVASKKLPLDLNALNGKEFSVDRLPIDFDRPRPFDIYLLGHDSAADHQIRFTQTSIPHNFSVEWRGLIALSYGGSYEFQYHFEAHIKSTKFEGVKLPDGTREREALSLFAPFVKNPEAFTLINRSGELWFQPKS